MQVFNFPNWVGYAALTAAAVCLIWLLGLWLSKKAKTSEWAWANSWSLRGDGWSFRRLVPLHKAAQRWVDSTPRSVVSLAERLAGDPRHYFVTYMLNQGDYPVFGVKPWATTWSEIGPSEISQSMAEKDGQTLTRLMSKEALYTRLAMRAGDIRKSEEGLRREIDELPGTGGS